MNGYHLLLLLLAIQQQPSCSLSTAPVISNRLFVAGLNPAVQAQDLEESFQKYGTITDVAVMDNGGDAVPFAFVTFKSVESAQNALVQEQSSTEMYKEVQPARPRNLRPKAQQRKLRTAQDWEHKQTVARESNVMLQLQQSHLDRWQELLMSIDGCQIIGSIPDTGSKTVALMGLNVEKVDNFLEWLQNLPFEPVGLNKVYAVDPSVTLILSEEEHTASSTPQRLLEAMQGLIPSDDSVVRLNVFPPKRMASLLKELEQSNVNVAPTGYTHFLNAVQLTDDQNKCAVWMLGLSDRTWSRMQQNGSVYNDEGHANVCRAYYKLEEALSRYTCNNDIWKKSSLVALDCGAAPGGWSKYLSEQPGVNHVYSIDPGALDQSVAALKAVQHVQLRVQDALPILLKDDVHIDVWVSDMCLHHVSEQLDWLLTARDMGLVGPGSFFILTLKCKVGHSKASFDAQVSEQCKRLDGVAEHLQTIHLFSNRNGERTVMGYLSSASTEQ